MEKRKLPLSCRLTGHRWVAGKCARCGLECTHEKKEYLDACRDYCPECGSKLPHHDWETTEIPWMKKCKVCGVTYVDPMLKNQIEREQERARTRARMRRAGEIGFERYQLLHRRRELQLGVKEGSFLCACCERVFPMTVRTKDHAAPLCKECAQTLFEKDGHLVFEKMENGVTVRTCVRCFQSEHQEGTKAPEDALNGRECALEVDPGTTLTI